MIFKTLQEEMSIARSLQESGRLLPGHIVDTQLVFYVTPQTSDQSTTHTGGDLRNFVMITYEFTADDGITRRGTARVQGRAFLAGQHIYMNYHSFGQMDALPPLGTNVIVAWDGQHHRIL
jgi:hypothetical protein